MSEIRIEENGLNVVFEVTEEGLIKLLHFSALPFERETLPKRGELRSFTMAELSVTGLDHDGVFFGNGYTRTAPGCRMKFCDLMDTRNESGRKLVVVTEDEETKLRLKTHFQFYDGLSIARVWNELENVGDEARGIEFLSSFALNGISKEGILPAGEKMKLWISRNAWQRELQWESFSFDELGLQSSQGEFHRSSALISVANTGAWSTKEYLPMAFLQNLETNSTLFWQIEHNGSWYWEIGDEDGAYNLRLSGPDELHSHCWIDLKPGESFTTVKAAVGSVIGGVDEAMADLTRYRRRIRRKNADNEKLPVIFNDYMNCLMGDPTTERELPMIERAAAIGCEYYCIDCGWYADGDWWDSVGEWLPSKKRFPGGLKSLLDAIRAHGMIPGLWLEIEVMGVKSPMREHLPEKSYFTRHGKRVAYRNRYQLDFTSPQVRAHADQVIDRLVNEYGVGYIKMDYNIEPGIGTERAGQSAGAGLLAHNRAYLSWLDSVFARYPDLVIENCSSGGMRMDYAMLSRHSIQSTSDEEGYIEYATIAANAPSAVCPEQAAVWSYPKANGDTEETIFNMVNAMLLRIHQSGQILSMSNERFELIREGISCYKMMRGAIKDAVPIFPLGFSKYTSSWSCLGVVCEKEKKIYLAVWRRNSKEDVIQIPIAGHLGQMLRARQLYPLAEEYQALCQWNPMRGACSVKLKKENTARLFVLEW